MHRLSSFRLEEKFKILEHSNYSEILPNNEKYEYCFFFFAGFNEHASKYVYVFKNFFENLDIDIPIKIIIPSLVKYDINDYPHDWITSPEKFSHIYSWYSFEKIVSPGGLSYRILYNKKKDEEVDEYIRKEIKKLGSSEKLIFCGFSMGGSYLTLVLMRLKIKTMCNIIFKSIINLNYFQNVKQEGNKDLSLNKAYMLYSLNDKIVIFSRAVHTIMTAKKIFDQVEVKVDSGYKHTVDYNCLKYLERILKKYFNNKGNF